MTQSRSVAFLTEKCRALSRTNVKLIRANNTLRRQATKAGEVEQIEDPRYAELLKKYRNLKKAFSYLIEWYDEKSIKDGAEYD